LVHRFLWEQLTKLTEGIDSREQTEQARTEENVFLCYKW